MERLRIPNKGMDEKLLFKTLESYRSKDLDWRSGKIWGYVYDAGEEVGEVLKKAYTMFLTENGLDPTVYPSQLRLENDVLAMAASHLRGDENVVGTFTSGGTESIILAVKAARDYFRAKRPDIQKPEMILPSTAHAAFHKAGELLDVRPVFTPVDSNTFISMDFHKYAYAAKGASVILYRDRVDPRLLSPSQLEQIMAMAGIRDNQLPDRMAAVNEILNTLPPEVCDYLLLDFFNKLYAPSKA